MLDDEGWLGKLPSIITSSGYRDTRTLVVCVLLTSKEKSTPPIRSQFTLKCKVRLHDTVIPTTKLRSASGCQGPGLVYKKRASCHLEILTGSITGFYLLIMTQCLDPRYEPACWTAYVPKSRALTLTLSSDGGYLLCP